jgi:glutamate/tyrosine decarboxylase-like PLP-dependent enzyme
MATAALTDVPIGQQAHSSIDKAAVIGGVQLRGIPHRPGTYDMDFEALARAIEVRAVTDNEIP